MPRRQVDDVAILDWAASDGPTLVVELRSLVETGSRRVLLDLSGFDATRADALETLTEARTVCDDRGCAIGLFGVDDAFVRVVEIMELGEDLPPVLGRAEADALVSLRGGAAAQVGNGQKPSAAAVAPAAAPVRPAEPEIDIELDPAHAPTAKFDKGEVVSISFGPRPVGAGAAGGGAGQTDDDLLAIDWAPLVATGYEIGGENPERIVAMAGGAAVAPASRTEAPTSPLPVQRKGPAAPAPAPIGNDDDVIDLDVAPARIPAGRGDRSAALRKTEVMPAFDVEAEAARQAAANNPGWGAPAAAVLGGREDQGGSEGFSPVDSGAGGPPAGVLARGPGPAPAPGRPSADRKSERFAPPGRRPVAAPIPAAAPRPAVYAAPPSAPTGGAFGDSGQSGLDSDDQTVMFNPGALDVAAALAAADAAAAAPVASPPAAPIEPPPAPVEEPAPAPVGDEEEETVMFQPGALDAELLAQVAAAAGPEVGVPPPAVDEPPPQQPAAPAEMGDARDVELRLFMHDHAIASPLHLQILERLVKTGDVAFGRSEIQLATGATLGVVSTVIDQLVQSRLVRRTRAPRSRGGVGFLLVTSPEKKNALQRLLKQWQAPATRAKVATWFES